jgi:flavin reductase (DIM6/NTAB) family NADH-FMN oxidoreductase RutF
VTDEASRREESARFRGVFGHLPTGVVIVTGLDSSGHPHGITIGSFTSISLDPPLAGFFIAGTSRTWPLIAETGKFTANVLAAPQSDLCWRFAKDVAEGSRFGDLATSPSTNGCPILPGVVAVVDCAVVATHRVGDHDLVVGSVTDLRVLDASTPAMVFFKGKTGDANVPR